VVARFNLEEERKRVDQRRLCDFYGRNVLVDYYVYREEKSPSILAHTFEHVFEGGLEGMGEGIDLGKGLL
jgi:hypothetical protein